MKLSDFSYDLPLDQIAHFPTANRSDSRLLVLPPAGNNLTHTHFHALADFLQPDDLLVLNDTKVIPARLYGQKNSGGKIEILVERVRDNQTILAHVRASKSPKPGTMIEIEHARLEVIDREADCFVLLLRSQGDITTLLQQYGHIPLPPYIRRADTETDIGRYQTLYARENGSVAAPTAGLHFDDRVFESLRRKGIRTITVTLHVGAGTFQPVRTDNITEHHMHAEWIEVSPESAAIINAQKAAGRRVIAVGTTSVRVLESAAIGKGLIAPVQKDTDIFIYPGYDFQIIDGLVTNFHLPESSLLMLVSALVGRERILKAYQTAIENGYRFYSYGDAMLLFKRT